MKWGNGKAGEGTGGERREEGLPPP